jgi:hypothetical protein
MGSTEALVDGDPDAKKIAANQSALSRRPRAPAPNELTSKAIKRRHFEHLEGLRRQRESQMEITSIVTSSPPPQAKTMDQ